MQSGLRNYLRIAFGWKMTYSILLFLNLAKDQADIITQQKFLENWKNKQNTHNEANQEDNLNLPNLIDGMKDKRFQRFLIVKEIDFYKKIPF